MNCNDTDKHKRKHMLPDSIYRLAAYLAMLLAITYIKPTEFPLSITQSSYVMLTAITIMYVEISVFVKNYKRKASPAAEILRVIAVPVLLYLLLCFCGTKSMDASLKGALTVIAIYGAFWIAITIYNTRQARSFRLFKGKMACGLSLLCDSVIMALLAVVLYQATINPMALGTVEQTAEYETWSSEYTVAANYDELKVLNSTKDFASITDTEERLKLFSEVVRVESNYLGIPYQLKVKCKTLTSAIGEYSDMSKTVYIDETFLNSCSPEEMIDVAAHETRHAYQHQLVHLYDHVGNDEESAAFLRNYNAEEYRSEFLEYTSPLDGEFQYSSQICVRDAREYAAASCEKWQSILQDPTLLESTGAGWDAINAKRMVNLK